MDKLLVGLLTIVVAGVILYVTVRIFLELLMWTLPVIMIAGILLGGIWLYEKWRGNK